MVTKMSVNECDDNFYLKYHYLKMAINQLTITKQMFMICKQSVIHLITILLLFNCVYAQNPSIKKPNGSVLLPNGKYIERDSVESSLQTIHDIATENLGTVCLTKSFCRLKVPLNVARYEGSRQKADLVALVLQDIGFNRHGNNIQLSESLSKGILSDESITGTRILTLNATDGHIITTVWWIKTTSGTINLYEDDGLRVGMPPNTNYPWFEVEDAINSIRSSKFIKTAPADSFKGFWTFPYYVCNSGRWIISYSVFIPSAGKYGVRGLLSVDIDVTHLQVNQCELLMAENKSVSLDLSKRNPEPTTTTTTILYQEDTTTNQIEAFHNSHKCHRETMQCDYRPFTGIAKKNQFGTTGWIRGAYQCLCRPGYYSLRHPQGFNGTIMEMAYQEYLDNISNYFIDAFQCIKCAPGCDHCTNGDPCLASYNWIFRFTILFISIMCATSTFIVAFYMYRHRKVKVFKVASPTFLLITLLGCAIMYLEMAAIFPILDTYSCIATKWTRHFGFCITYTSLLMKTWRVSLTYRVKSAHKVKLTDKQLLQWMVPILLVMLIYLSTWTLSATPVAVVITDQDGLKFKQCSYNWWDHSLAIGEVLFLAWGIRVCYNVRNAESLYNEAKLISYAIYNIAIVNITMISFHLFIFPKAGPDIKYLLGFIRTQLSTSTTIALVFGPKVLRVIRGQGDQWDQRARLRGVTASFSFNGNGLVAEDPPDLYIENEELKEEIQKLAAQMEFMKIVHMEINNRHLNPKPGGYFSASKHGVYKALAQQARKQSQQNSGVSDNGHSASNSIGTNSIGYQAAQQPQNNQPGMTTVVATSVATNSALSSASAGGYSQGFV